jgi:hypothetical protein
VSISDEATNSHETTPFSRKSRKRSNEAGSSICNWSARKGNSSLFLSKRAPAGSHLILPSAVGQSLSTSDHTSRASGNPILDEFSSGVPTYSRTSGAWPKTARAIARSPGCSPSSTTTSPIKSRSPHIAEPRANEPATHRARTRICEAILPRWSSRSVHWACKTQRLSMRSAMRASVSRKDGQLLLRSALVATD